MSRRTVPRQRLAPSNPTGRTRQALRTNRILRRHLSESVIDEYRFDVVNHVPVRSAALRSTGDLILCAVRVISSGLLWRYWSYSLRTISPSLESPPKSRLVHVPVVGTGPTFLCRDLDRASVAPAVYPSDARKGSVNSN